MWECVEPIHRAAQVAKAAAPGEVSAMQQYVAVGHGESLRVSVGEKNEARPDLGSSRLGFGARNRRIFELHFGGG